MIERYSRAAMRDHWNDATRVRVWLNVELAACTAMEQAGIVPKGTAESVRGAVGDKLDPVRIAEIEARTKHDVIAFLTHVEELAGEPARWLHLGMTSSDVLDSSLAILTRDALGALIQGVDGVRSVLAERAREHRHTVCIGRSHGIHAEPITAGLVFARWYCEMSRARQRLVRAQRAVSVGKSRRRSGHLRQS